MSSIQPDSPWRGAAAFYPQPVNRTDELGAQYLVETIYYFNTNRDHTDQPLADIEYRSSDGELDTRRHVFRWDRAHYTSVFQNGFAARRQRDTPDSTYYNLVHYVNFGGRPLNSERPTMHAFISTTLSSQWHPTVPTGEREVEIYRYEIYAPGGIWISETLEDRYQYPAQDEVAFPAGIAPQYIRSAQLFILTVDGQHTRRRRADTRLLINTNFNPQSCPQSSLRIQRPVRGYRDTNNRMTNLTIVEYPGRARVNRAGVVSNDFIIDYYEEGVTQIETYIDSAFRSNKENEAYMFFNKEFALINYAPGSTNDYVINGPLLISDGFPSLAGTAFAEYGIDAAFGCPGSAETTGGYFGPAEAFIFSGNLCAKINYAPGTTADWIIDGPKTIKQMFPFFKGTKFEKGVDAAFESTVVNEAFLFKGSEYARINYSNRTLKAKARIVDGFKCFVGTKFSSDIGAAFASHNYNNAYLFKDNEYVLLHFAPGGSSDYIVTGPKQVLNNWSSLKKILPCKNGGLDIYDDKRSLPRDQDEY